MWVLLTYKHYLKSHNLFGVSRKRNNTHRAFFSKAVLGVKAHTGTAVPGDAGMWECSPTALAGCWVKNKYRNKEVQKELSF